MLMLKKEFVIKITARIKEELEFYEAIVAGFEQKYGCSLEEFERRIEHGGNPVGQEALRDREEWRSALAEVERLKAFLRELEKELELVGASSEGG